MLAIIGATIYMLIAFRVIRWLSSRRLPRVSASTLTVAAIAIVLSTIAATLLDADPNAKWAQTAPRWFLTYIIAGLLAMLLERLEQRRRENAHH